MMKYCLAILSVLLLLLTLISCGAQEEETPEETETEKETMFLLPRSETEYYEDSDITLKEIERAPVSEGMREFVFRPLSDKVFGDEDKPENREESHKITVCMQVPDAWYPTDAASGDYTKSKSFLCENDYFVELADVPSAKYSVRYDLTMKVRSVYYFEGGITISPNFIRYDPEYKSASETMTPSFETTGDGTAYILYSVSADKGSSKLAFVPITYDRVLCLEFFCDSETVKKCVDTLRVGVGYFSEDEIREPEVIALKAPDKTAPSDQPIEAATFKEAFEKISALEGGLSISERYTLLLSGEDAVGEAADYKGFRVEKGELSYLASLEVKDPAKNAKKDDPRTVSVSFCLERKFPEE